MPWKRQVLVVANVTVGSGELLSTLTKRGELGPMGVTLVIPATPLDGGRQTAAQRLEDALARFRDAGLEVDGLVGDGDPFVAVTAAWDPKLYDEIIVSTLPMRVSKWLHAGLPERIERVTGALVTHVVSEPPGPPHTTSPAPVHEDHGVLSPLSVLGWAGPKHA